MSFKTTLIATASALVLSAPAALAMSDELTQLEQAVAAELVTYGIDESYVQDATIGDLAQVRTVLNSNASTQLKAQRIEEILSVADPEPTVVESVLSVDWSSSLEEIVANDLLAFGIEADTENLTVGELSMIKTVLSTDDTTAGKKQRIEAIITN